MAAPALKHALERGDEIEITVTGRSTGRPHTFPVWSVVEGDTLYLIPVNGTGSEWYKNVLKHPSIRINAHGATITATAKPIKDPKKIAAVVEKFREKYGAANIKKYYAKLDVAVAVPLA